MKARETIWETGADWRFTYDLSMWGNVWAVSGPECKSNIWDYAWTEVRLLYGDMVMRTWLSEPTIRILNETCGWQTRCHF